MSKDKNPLRPIFPWEIKEAEARHSKSHHNHDGTHNNNTSHHRHPNNSRRQGLNHRPFLAVLFLVTMALAAGTLLDGDSSSSTGSTSHSNATKTGKERGAFLPAASSKQEGIAEDMFQAYKKLEEDYHAKAFHPSNQQKWKELNRKGGAKVSILEHASDPTCPYVKMEAIIPAPVASCWNFLSIENWEKSMPKMDPTYESHAVYSNYTTPEGVNMILVRKRTKRILAFGKRDFAFLSVSDLPLSDGTWVSGTVSVETPDVPRESSYTRGFQDSIAFYKPVISPETGQEQCHVTIICRIDLNDSTVHGSGGFVPMWLYVKTVGATGLKSVLKMSAALVKMNEEMDAALINKETSSDSDTSVAGTPTSQSVSSPPTFAPVSSQQRHSTSIKSRENAAATIGQTLSTKPWNLAPGGAFAGVLATPQQTVLLLEESYLKYQSQQKWKQPLYGIFTHVASSRVDIDRNGQKKFGLPFLFKVPFLAKHRRIEPSTNAKNI